MKLDKFTYGKSPAAIYLAFILNERNDQKLTRKVSQAICSNRRLIHDVVAAHYLTDEISTKSFSTLVHMLDAQMRTAAEKIGDEHIRNLFINILSGEIKTYKNRVMHARRLTQRLTREAGPGIAPPVVKAVPYSREESAEERNERLMARSRAYLHRKDKPNTLY